MSFPDTESAAEQLAALREQMAAARARRIAASRTAHAAKAKKAVEYRRSIARLGVQLGWADAYRRRSDSAVIQQIRELIELPGGRFLCAETVRQVLMQFLGPSGRQLRK